mgnify:FL=1|tara:strand:+ start:1200 stop:1403 length:204 start_codon:yes stop_codon:yes gene_type:complete
METITKLMSLNKDSQQIVLLWILRDLINWKTNDRVREDIRGHSAMLYEAIQHQINKAYDKQTKNEEE